jgi:signal transduction histidine kinase
MEGEHTSQNDSPNAAVTHRRLVQLKWLTTIVPAIAVFTYETIRHSLLESVLPEAYGNLIVGLLALVLAYGFSDLVFGIIEHLQRQAIERSREVAVLNTLVEERGRLSRELHDGLAQLTAYLLMRIDTVESLITAGRLPEAVDELERLRTTADGLYTDVRESISGLRAEVVEKGLVNALADYAIDFGERHGIDVSLNVGVIPDPVSPLAQLQLFGIAQEALANVRRHAAAAHVRIALEADPAGLALTVADDGHGFVPDVLTGASGGYGLTMMRERAESLGGALEIRSLLGEGTRISATLPLPPPAAREGIADAALARR